MQEIAWVAGNYFSNYELFVLKMLKNKKKILFFNIFLKKFLSLIYLDKISILYSFKINSPLKARSFHKKLKVFHQITFLR